MDAEIPVSTPSTGTKRSRKSSSAARPNNKRRRDSSGSDAQCKTCSHCRFKKIKCDSNRPSCQACETNGIQCEYPRDTRRLTRPSQGRLDELEKKIEGIWDFISAANTLARPPMITSPRTFAQVDSSYGSNAGDGNASSASIPNEPAMIPSFASPTNSSATQQHPRQMSLAGHHDSSQVMPATHFRNPSINHQTGTMSADFTVSPRSGQIAEQADASDDKDESARSHLSPREARIAGLDVGQDGVISVHGPSSMMHHEQSGRNAQMTHHHEKSSLKASKARLISYAVIQRQSEAFIWHTLPSSMDLDGVEPELARHLIDMHWNRHHYGYLLTYRPAIMDSLANGGPWCNKLLLNAIYYTSALYSDRESLRRSPGDNQSAGDRFYDRFRTLLVDEIVKPSIPSAAALLITGVSLVSQGRISAGWNLCGTAYRMVTDMGCHIAIHSRNHPVGDPSRDLSIDVENEWRRRLYWGALVTDATQSMYLGRSMTLRFNEGRVPRMFLDSYEELEEWKPYIDELQPPEPNDPLMSYRSRPAFAVSTFTSLIRLAEISAKITQAFYSLDCTKSSHEEFMRSKATIEEDLANWKLNLPAHLQFNPGIDPVPPPHQITPHTTYHVLNILLARPFLDGGHLQDHIAPEQQAALEENCTASAFAIRKYVSDYRDAFSLRRAPFLLSYAVYSAVIVMLRQSKRDQRQQFQEMISFFLIALAELQRNCNFGLRKPMTIVRKMISELGDYVPQPAENAQSEVAPMQSTVDMETFQSAFASPADLQPDFSADWANPMFDVSPTGFFDMPDDQERPLADDSLYGLFAYQASAF